MEETYKKSKAYTNAVFQVSILDALMQGVMEGHMTVKELLEHGDFGIGTLEGLDGELLVLRGDPYCAMEDGTVRPVGSEEKVSFAQVTFFDEFSPLHMMERVDSSQDLRERLSAWAAEDPNIIYAVQGCVEHADVSVRSIGRQEPPYPSLAEAAKTQKVHSYHDVSGSMLGFLFPRFMEGVNMASWHFHFLSNEKNAGGHMLDISAPSIRLKVYPIYEQTVRLPESKAFSKLKLEPSEERKEALLKAEQ